MGSREGLWTNPHVPNRFLCWLRGVDRCSFHPQSIWRLWLRGAQYLQIAARHRFRTMSRMILNRFESGFTVRCVGFETPSSGSWICCIIICILLSFMISQDGKSGSFDILVLANIIQRGMEHVTSIRAQISYETSKQSIFTFLRSRSDKDPIWCRTSK